MVFFSIILEDLLISKISLKLAVYVLSRWYNIHNIPAVTVPIHMVAQYGWFYHIFRTYQFKQLYINLSCHCHVIKNPI